MIYTFLYLYRPQPNLNHMKKILIILVVMSLMAEAAGQEQKIKTGWKFGGALPAISFDSDLGFQYGALAEFFNYGDGSSLKNW